jgi:hypothetical protein
MPGKSTAGYTKQANKQKFVRNRDIKLTEKEQKAESHIKQTMNEGICPKCREKMQWRFQYNKYKPLKAVGNCQKCRRKCITKAYRTYCDECASKQHVCPSCCCDMNEALQAKKERDEYMGSLEGGDEDNGMEDGNGDQLGQKRQAQGSARMKKTSQKSAKQSGSMGGEDDSDCDGEEYADEDAMSDSEDTSRRRVDSGGEVGDGDISVVESDGQSGQIQLASQWDVHKFEAVAHSKYSKARVVGSTEDTVFTFGYTPSVTTHDNDEGESGEGGASQGGDGLDA